MAKYGKKSQSKVKAAMEEMKEHKLKSGKSGKTVTNPKQAIAIGLSEARAEGVKVPCTKKEESCCKKENGKASGKETAKKAVKAKKRVTTKRVTKAKKAKKR